MNTCVLNQPLAGTWWGSTPNSCAHTGSSSRQSSTSCLSSCMKPTRVSRCVRPPCWLAPTAPKRRSTQQHGAWHCLVGIYQALSVPALELSQDMACDTFLKICNRCRRKFVVLQVQVRPQPGARGCGGSKYEVQRAGMPGKLIWVLRLGHLSIMFSSSARAPWHPRPLPPHHQLPCRSVSPSSQSSSPA